VLQRIYEREFPIDEETDVAYGIAVLLAPVGRYEDALWFFERSRAQHGPRAVGQFNVALCHLHLESPTGALEALEEAIALDPQYTAAIELRQAVLDGRASPD
jgi:tetratricopeptide (TPR) repeat protein